MMQSTANENAAGLRRISERFDLSQKQKKIERLGNNDARLILLA